MNLESYLQTISSNTPVLASIAATGWHWQTTSRELVDDRVSVEAFYIESNVAPLFHAIVNSTQSAPVHSKIQDLLEKPEWEEKEYRQAYAEAAVEQGIAFQVRINREKRRMTQADLALAIGTKQSAISRMEDPEYGKHSIPQLIKVAAAFDCSLIIKLASFSCLARESNSLSEDELYAASYDEEIPRG